MLLILLVILFACTRLTALEPLLTLPPDSAEMRHGKVDLQRKS